METSNSRKAGMAGVAIAATLSLTATAGMFCYAISLSIIIRKDRYRGVRPQFARAIRFLRTQSGRFFLNLVLSDMIQSFGFALNFRWASQRVVNMSGSICTIQGVAIQVGDCASALWVATIAIHTMFTLAFRKRFPEWGFYLIIASIWLAVVILASIGPAVLHTDRKGPYYAPAGGWCWVSSEYNDARLYLHYLYIFIAILINAICHVVVFFMLRAQSFKPFSIRFGTSSQSQSESSASSQATHARTSTIIVSNPDVKTPPTSPGLKKESFPSNLKCSFSQVKRLRPSHVKSSSSYSSTSTKVASPSEEKPLPLMAAIDLVTLGAGQTGGGGTAAQVREDETVKTRQQENSLFPTHSPSYSHSPRSSNQIPHRPHPLRFVNSNHRAIPSSQSRSHAQSLIDRTARKMLWYPPVYMVLCLPLAAFRLAGIAHHDWGFHAQIACGCLFTLAGLANVTLYWVTRKMGPGIMKKLREIAERENGIVKERKEDGEGDYVYGQSRYGYRTSHIPQPSSAAKRQFDDFTFPPRPSSIAKNGPPPAFRDSLVGGFAVDPFDYVDLDDNNKATPSPSKAHFPPTPESMPPGKGGEGGTGLDWQPPTIQSPPRAQIHVETARRITEGIQVDVETRVETRTEAGDSPWNSARDFPEEGWNGELTDLDEDQRTAVEESENIRPLPPRTPLSSSTQQRDPNNRRPELNLDLEKGLNSLTSVTVSGARSPTTSPTTKRSPVRSGTTTPTRSSSNPNLPFRFQNRQNKPSLTPSPPSSPINQHPLSTTPVQNTAPAPLSTPAPTSFYGDVASTSKAGWATGVPMGWLE